MSGHIILCRTWLARFEHMNTPAGRDETFSTAHCKVADKSKRGSTGILGSFWTFFISVNGIKNFPYEQKTKFVPPTGPARLPGSYKGAVLSKR